MRSRLILNGGAPSTPAASTAEGADGAQAAATTKAAGPAGAPTQHVRGENRAADVEALIRAAEEADAAAADGEGNDPSSLTVDEAATTRKYKVVIDGEEQEVGLDELLKGYQRHSDYTRKTQTVADARKDLDRQRSALFDSEAYKQLKAVAEADSGTFDPYDPDSFLKKMKQEVAAQLLETLGPAEQALHQENARVKAKAFIDGKPEFKDAAFKSGVADLLKTNANLGLEEAYWIVKGRRADEQLTRSENERVEHRRMLKEAGINIGSGRGRPDTGSVPDHVKKRGAFEIYKYLEAQQKR